MRRFHLVILLFVASQADAQRTVSYVCSAKSSSVYLTSGLKHLGEVNRRKKLGWHVEFIDVTSLVKSTREDDPRGFYRVASRKIARECGVFKIVIAAGWLNANPYGYLGAIEFPMIEISRRAEPVLRRTALHSCEPNRDLYAAGGCPDAFANVIELKWDHKMSAATLSLLRDQPQ